MSELDQLRQEAEQLKNQIRVKLYHFTLHFAPSDIDQPCLLYFVTGGS